ncbi:MAG TPA: hypothetical protein DDZ80_20310 [Cyanobacteria bacterium UBA8803]|nr:hypothetical protein [Cyanobacteria bacterium UBA9273]HBL60694.1 hypothetical protein [Cyanobacteria bacterium UBA8803]
MAGTIQIQPTQAIALTIDRILDTGQLTRLEHLQLVTTILSDYKVTDEERSQINRVLDELQVGHLKFRE